MTYNTAVYPSPEGEFGVWKNWALNKGLATREVLTPLMTFDVDPTEEFPWRRMVKEPRQPDEREQEDLKRAIGRLRPWDYYVDFCPGVDTNFQGTVIERRLIEFHRYRANLIWRFVTRRILEDPAGLKQPVTTLDLACNCGLFAFDAAFYSDRVVGMDLRWENIKRARLIQEYFDIHNVSTTAGNVLTDPLPPADIVLNLGLMYHLSDPLGALEKAYHACRYMTIVDSICHLEPVSAWHLVQGKSTESSIEGDKHYEMQPTYRGLLDAMKAVGFRDIIEIRGTSEGRVDLYREGVRRCLVGFK